MIGSVISHAQSSLKANYWQLSNDGGISWTWDGRSHYDHIEMSGKRMSVVMRYGVNAQGNFSCNFGMVWPMLRTVPNKVHDSFQRHIAWEPLQAVTINKRSLNATSERTRMVHLHGLMVVESKFGSLEVRRVLSPSTELPAVVMNYTLKNRSKRPIDLCIDDMHATTVTPASVGVDGGYYIEQVMRGTGKKQLQPNDSVEFSAMIYAHRKGEKVPDWDAKTEIARRQALVSSWMSNLVLTTPDPIINRMFAFSKIRSQESIFQTKAGPLHGPGGEAYYAACWANDQAEYANPFFPFTGYDYALASAMNCYRLFARYTNKEWKYLPTSIISEGTDYWNDAGDRGDAAMIAYGAGRVALETNKTQAEQLWPLITWCLEYCHRKRNAEGVVESDCDELEHRFPTGKANLCTSSLYYDALISASYLAHELGKGHQLAKTYERQAKEMRQAIDRYFHANMDGFDTYRYYDGNTQLRSWICIPLVMGIFDHAKGTLAALFSPRLWTGSGLLTQEGNTTYWDRTTLYAFRGSLMAGDTERTLKLLKAYSTTRLMGSHVPYAIEAWPEGDQRHLAAESALYARIITEGLFGIRATGWNTFTVSPRLPKEWPEMTLSHIRLNGGDFTLTVKRNNHGNLIVQRWVDGKLREQKKGTDRIVFHVK